MYPFLKYLPRGSLVTFVFICCRRLIYCKSHDMSDMVVGIDSVNCHELVTLSTKACVNVRGVATEIFNDNFSTGCTLNTNRYNIILQLLSFSLFEFSFSRLSGLVLLHLLLYNIPLYHSFDRLFFQFPLTFMFSPMPAPLALIYSLTILSS